LQEKINTLNDEYVGVKEKLTIEVKNLTKTCEVLFSVICLIGAVKLYTSVM
jgi:hypothetical protein